MALMAAQHTGNLSLVRWVESLYEKYRAKVFDTPADTMHDLGFMYTLYSTLAYRLTGSDTMKELSVRAARCWHIGSCPMEDIFAPGGAWTTVCRITLKSR